MTRPLRFWRKSIVCCWVWAYWRCCWEARAAVNRMTELIDSLLEFSRTRASLRPTYGSLRRALDNAIQAVKSTPEFHEIRIDVHQMGKVEGWFDHRKLERAFFNLLLNA